MQVAALLFLLDKTLIDHEIASPVHEISRVAHLSSHETGVKLSRAHAVLVFKLAQRCNQILQAFVDVHALCQVSDHFSALLRRGFMKFDRDFCHCGLLLYFVYHAEGDIGHCRKEEVTGLTLEEEWDLLPSLLLQQTDDK